MSDSERTTLICFGLFMAACYIIGGACVLIGMK